MHITVFGMGYVGMVSAVCYARNGHVVIGVDIDPVRVEEINAGRAPIRETDLDELLQASLAAGRLRATTDSTDALANSEMALLCVGTPSGKDGEMNLSTVRQVCHRIGEALAARATRRTGDDVSVDPLTVVVRSTVLPGTTEEVIIPALEAYSGLKEGRDFTVCVHPEFLRQGSALKDFDDPPLTVIGANDPRAAAAVSRLYHPPDEERPALEPLPIRAAEVLKFACNAFHALKVSFANEIGSVCKAHGVDGQVVMQAFCQDTRLNISPAYLLPGGPFGGSCLPKDLRALNSHAARLLEAPTPVLSAALESNHLHIERVVQMALRSGGRIGLLGICYKAGTDDLRESPLVALALRLLQEGREVAFFDPAAGETALKAADRALLAGNLPLLSPLRCYSLDALLETAEVVVLGKRDAAFAHLGARLRPGQRVIDLVRAVDPEHTAATYEGICW